MILPIYAYGQPVLKKKCRDIDPDYPDLAALIENMWETMYHARGVGLAAPQIGKSIRLFLVDTLQLEKEEGENKGIKQAFINAEIIEEGGEPWNYEEGCLSIPKINGEVERPDRVTIRFVDEGFVERQETYTGMEARVIQHEYDHIEGKLFVDLLNPLKRRLIQRKLEAIRKGRVSADYVLKFVQ